MFLLLIGVSLLGSVTSQSLMDLSMTAIFLLFVKDLVTKKVSIKTVFPIGIEWAFLGYFLVAVIGLFLNGKPPIPWWFYLSKFNWVLNLYVLIYAFDQSKKHLTIRNLCIFFSIAFLIPNLYAIATYVCRYDFIQHIPIHAAKGMVNSATYHAHGNSLIFVFFCTLLAFQFEHLSKKLNLIFALSLVLMGLSIFVSFTRGIWGACFLSLLLIASLRDRKMVLYFLLSVLVIGGSVYLLSPAVQTRLNSSFTSWSDQLRMDLLLVHLQMFKAHPWVGIGYWESYRQIADYWPLIGRPPNYFESHAHNQYVSVLATTGIFGFFFFGSIFLFFIKKNIALLKEFKSQQTSLNYALAASLFILIVQFALACLTDVTFEYAKIRGILIIGFAMVVSLYSNHLKEKNQKRN